MNKNVLIAIILLLLVGGGAYFFMNQNSTSNSEALMEDSPNPTTVKEEDTTMMQEDKTETNGEETAIVKEFTVNAKPFSFDPAEIRVKQGDTVRITLNNEQGMHDWTLDEFNAKTKTLSAGETETIEFVADKTGTFEYYCSVMSHRAQGMVGNLIVE